MKEILDIKSLTGEATAYDKKQMLEVKRPKSWLKSISAFANGEGGTLIFGISDDNQVLGLADAEGDAEKISEDIKSKLDPVPSVNLEYKGVDGKKLILLHVYPGQETPYYYDDRLEIYSPGGMMDGRLIQQLNPLTVPSKRRNPLLADFFNRLGLMERRGSGMKKIINTYKHYEHLSGYHIPGFTSNASEFHVTLWNLNFENDITGEITPHRDSFIQKFVKANGDVVVKEFAKEPSKFAKEFVKASRQIYRLISQNPQISAAQMAENMELSARQVQKYLKRLQELQKIARVGGRKIGEWKIIDEEYEGFFDRI